MNILNGKEVSAKILNEISTEVSTLNQGQPHLVVIMVGDNPASKAYVNNKQKSATRANIQSTLLHFEESITEEFLLQEIEKLNQDPEIDGFFVQLPLPPHINKNKIIEAIHPDKDVDGFHPTNFGKMALGQDGFKPATPYGICKLLKYYDIETQGKHCVVIGRSNIVGKPLAIMLGNDFQIGRCTVTSTDINTPPQLLQEECRRADIIVVAVGKPNFLTPDMVNEGAIIIDVGINKVENKIVGDVDPAVYDKCAWVTPVPGGVGPMTIAALMYNTLQSFKRKF